MANYRIHSAIINGTPCALQSSSLNMDPEIEEVINSGDSTLAIAVINRILHRFTIETTDIKKLQRPVCGPATVFLTCDDECGNVSATQFLSLDIARAVIFPLRITGKPARLQIEMVALSVDGVTCPVTLGTTAGPTVSISSVWRPCGAGAISNQTLDFGYTYQFPDPGGIYQVESFLEKQAPKLSFDTRDKDAITQARLCGTECISLTLEWCEVLKCASVGGTCSVTVEGLVALTTLTADVGQPGTSTITVYGEGGVTLV